MVPVEPISLSIGVAALFTSCIECFEYFKAARGFEQNFEVLLVKLEYQQERLLVWGDVVGIGTGERHDLDPTLGNNNHIEDLTRRCLTSVETLLKDAEVLISKYGVRAYTPASDTATHSGISSNALKRLRLRLARQPQGPSVFDKTRWAIHDETKFQKLVDDVRDLIDGLTTRVPVSTELQEQKVQDDIAAMVDDIRSLHLFQEACKDDYPKWWTATSAAIDASEVATLDNRVANEYVDNYGPSRQDVSGDVTSLQLYFGDGKVYIGANAQIWFLLTGSCRAQDTETPCDQLHLGEMSFEEKYSFIAPGSILTGSAPGYRITKHINPSRFTSADLEKYVETQEQILAHRLAADELFVPEEDNRFHVRVYIYCPPCACQVATALDICQYSNKKPFVEFHIRIDHHQMCSCSTSGSRIDGLVSVIEFVKEMEGKVEDPGRLVNCLKTIDRDWLERQVYNYAEEDRLSTLSPTEQLARIAEFHKHETSCAAIIQLGEVDYCVPLMGVPPFQPFEPGRVPRDSQLFRYGQEWHSIARRLLWKREYMGTYTPRAPLPPRQQKPLRPAKTKADENAKRGVKRSRSSASDDESS